MTEEKSNQHKWYGEAGIDTSYERSLINYSPKLKFPEKTGSFDLSPEVVIQILRSEDFMVSKTILGYKDLINKIEEYMNIIKRRNNRSHFQSYLDVLKERSIEEVFKKEEEVSGYQGIPDYEIYTILYLMKESLEDQVDFIDERYRVQFTGRSEDQEIVEDEIKSINEWIAIEYDLMEAYEEVSHADEKIEEISVRIEELERKRREIDNLHTSLADISYVHKNRIVAFTEILEDMEVLVLNKERVAGEGVRRLLDSLALTESLTDIKLHLIMSFKDYRVKHESLKQQYLMVDSQKEKYISEKQYFYQNIVVDVNDKTKNWLYDQEEGSSQSLDIFASILVNSVSDTKKDYEVILSELLNYYQTESAFYGEQILLILKKQEIRQFIEIIDDLEEAGVVTEEWIDKYLIDRGYEEIST